LVFTGDIAQGRAHLDHAIRLYDPAEHRPLARWFGQYIGVAALFQRSLSLWMLGYPEAALANSDKALGNAREISQAATLMFALHHTSITRIHCGHYAIANAQLDEVVALADEKSAAFWKAMGMLWQGCLFTLTGKASDAVRRITAQTAALQSTGARLWMPMHISYLTRAYAELDQFDDARRCIGEAMTVIQTTGEKWYESEVHRIAGEIALMGPEPNAAKAEACFERALAVARAQQAKSWELRAATSMARLRCDQGRRDEARDLLAPVYGWFTEGLDTLDLKEAKALLDALAS